MNLQSEPCPSFPFCGGGGNGQENHHKQGCRIPTEPLKCLEKTRKSLIAREKNKEFPKKQRKDKEFPVVPEKGVCFPRDSFTILATISSSAKVPTWKSAEIVLRKVSFGFFLAGLWMRVWHTLALPQASNLCPLLGFESSECASENPES